MAQAVKHNNFVFRKIILNLSKVLKFLRKLTPVAFKCSSTGFLNHNSLYMICT